MFPDDAADLHRISALIAGRTPVAAIPAADWPALVQRADQHGLAPMLWWLIKQQGLDPTADPTLAPLIETAHHTAMGAALLDRALRQVEGVLRQAHIPTLWLKGAALAPTIYPAPELRPMGDLDVLVPYEQREQALEVVQRSGYDFYSTDAHIFGGGRNALVGSLSHHYHLRGGPGGTTLLEVHYRLLSNDDTLLTLDHLDWFWSQRRALTLSDGFSFTTLTPEAHFLYLCAHALLQHGGETRYLLRFLDLHRLITHSPIAWEIVVDQAVVLGWTTAAAQALRVIHDYFQTPIPDDVLNTLQARRPAHEDATRIARLSGAGSRWQHVRDRLGKMSSRDRLIYLVRVTVPGPAYMRERYRVPVGKAVWPYYGYRWFDQARDIAAAGWKRITGQYRRP